MGQIRWLPNCIFPIIDTAISLGCLRTCDVVGYRCYDDIKIYVVYDPKRSLSLLSIFFFPIIVVAISVGCLCTCDAIDYQCYDDIKIYLVYDTPYRCFLSFSFQ